MSCALGEWQHSRPVTLHQVVDAAGKVVETFRNLFVANRVATANGLTVKSVGLASVTQGNTECSR